MVDPLELVVEGVGHGVRGVVVLIMDGVFDWYFQFIQLYTIYKPSIIDEFFVIVHCLRYFREFLFLR